MSDAPHAGESWRDMIERLRESGALDVDQETVLFRFFSEKEVVQAQALARIAAEHVERISADGKPSADTWLQDTAQRMGREDREDTERTLSSLGVALPMAG